MQPRHIGSGGGRLGDFADDRVKRERSGVDDPRVSRTQRQQVVGHDRARIKAYGASAQESLSANGDQIGGTWSCTDEVDGHSLVTTHCVTGIAGRQPVNLPSGSPM